MQGWKIVIGGSLENYVQKVDVMYNFLISYTLTLKKYGPGGPFVHEEHHFRRMMKLFKPGFK